MFKEKREVSVCVYMCVSYSVMSDCNHGLSMEFSRQEYWRGLPFPSPGDLPDPGIEPGSPVLPTDSLLKLVRKEIKHLKRRKWNFQE